LAFPEKTIKLLLFKSLSSNIGWGGRIRTFACMDQNHVP
jgi:hypothetical protein